MVAIVVGSTLALVAGAARAGSAPARFAEATELAEIVVFIGDEVPPAELVDKIAADPRVERVNVSTVVKLGAGEPAGPESNAIISARTRSAGTGDPCSSPAATPTPGSTDEILLNERGAERAGIRAGDRVPLTALPCFDCEEVSIGDALVVGVVRLSEDLIDDPGTQLIVLAGPALAGGRWREAEQPGTILSLQVADGTDSSTLTADLSTLVGSLGNASDQEVDTETIDRAAALQRDALLLAAVVAAGAGALIVGQAVARHLQRRPSDAAALGALGLGTRGSASTPPSPPCSPPWRRVPSPGWRSPRSAARRSRSARPAGRTPTPRSGSIRRSSLSVGSPRSWRSRWSPLPRRCAGPRRGRHRPRPVGVRWALLIEGLGLRPAPATGARFALDAGRGRQRLPVIPTLVTVTATIAVGVAAIVVHTDLDRMLTTPARFGQPWAYCRVRASRGRGGDAGPGGGPAGGGRRPRPQRRGERPSCPTDGRARSRRSGSTGSAVRAASSPGRDALRSASRRWPSPARRWPRSA